MVSLRLLLCPFRAVNLFWNKMAGRAANRSQQTKVISLFVVIAVIGFLLITTSYKGLLRNPLRGGFSRVPDRNNVVVDKEITEALKTSAVVQQQLRQQLERNEIEKKLKDEALKQEQQQKESIENEKLIEKGAKDEKETEKKEENVAVANDKGKMEDSEHFYGVMFDAGSTGSRVHAFKFRKTSKDKPFELEDALFKFNSEGLSHFADEPKEGAESIRKLLDEAKAYVPEAHWSHTPLALKATAGLRALPQQQSDVLLKEVSTLFKNSPFKVEEDAVSIMDGDEEGIFSWFTLNFLMGVLGDVNKMVGAMDLGGGSTQITFVTTSNNNKPEYLENMDIFGHNFSLYTHSYLGLGLMAGRFQTLGGKEPASEEEGRSYTTPCVSAGKTTLFDYQGYDFNVTGSQTNASDRYKECQKLTDAVVTAGHIDQPPQVKSLPFIIFSYYYDRAVAAHLIDSSKGGDIKVMDFINAAKKECETMQGKDFACLDLTYISSLLTTGFNFSPDTQISLRKRVNNYEVSWALGAMFHLLKEE